MCDQDHFEQDREEYEALGLVTRRQFGAILGAGVAMMLPAVVNAVAVTESEVNIMTPDGTADCYFVHPATGAAAGVIVWPDIFGLRPAMRQMGKRLAENGYSVLVVNPFYRIKKAPAIEDPSTFSFQNPSDMAKLQPLMASIGAPGAAEKDAAAFVAWLDQQPQVNKAKKIGTQGYCMGGPLVVRTAAAVRKAIGPPMQYPCVPIFRFLATDGC